MCLELSKLMKSAFLGIFLIATVVFGVCIRSRLKRPGGRKPWLRSCQQQPCDQDARLDRQEMQVAGLADQAGGIARGGSDQG